MLRIGQGNVASLFGRLITPYLSQSFAKVSIIFVTTKTFAYFSHKLRRLRIKYKPPHFLNINHPVSKINHLFLNLNHLSVSNINHYLIYISNILTTIYLQQCGKNKFYHKKAIGGRC